MLKKIPISTNFRRFFAPKTVFFISSFCRALSETENPSQLYDFGSFETEHSEAVIKGDRLDSFEASSITVIAVKLLY